MKRAALITTIAISLTACASTSTTRLSQNMVQIDVSAAPACGRTGAIRLVNRMAAVETIRLGYDKYLIAGQDSQSNVRVLGYNANTTGTVYGSGNYATYSGTTTMTPIVGGTQDAAVVVAMFRDGIRQDGMP